MTNIEFKIKYPLVYSMIEKNLWSEGINFDNLKSIKLNVSKFTWGEAPEKDEFWILIYKGRMLDAKSKYPEYFKEKNKIFSVESNGLINER